MHATIGVNRDFQKCVGTVCSYKTHIHRAGKPKGCWQPRDINCQHCAVKMASRNSEKLSFYEVNSIVLYYWRKTDVFPWPVKVISYDKDENVLTVEFLYVVRGKKEKKER